MKKIVPILFVLVVASILFAFVNPDLESQNKFEGETIEITSSDGLKIKADVYEIDNDKAPVILLFHQAGYSRGEYRPIAPKLNDLGFNCIAIDQRSGEGVNDVINETYLEAKKKGMGVSYPDAFPDLETSLNFAKEKFGDRKIIVWGSSYSASLVLILANKYSKDIDAVLSFSPGEYFEYENKKVNEFAPGIKCPVFITSAKNENESWAKIFKEIPSTEKSSFLPEMDGYHGSKALWENKDGHEVYWEAVESFLSTAINK